MRVLLIEDDKKAARLLARGLQEEGFVVDIAHSGELGQELAGANRYVSRGQIEILIPTPDRNLGIEVLGVGDLFGEFDGEAPFTMACALGDVELLRVGKEELLGLLREHPETSLSLVPILARRVQQREMRLRECSRRRPRSGVLAMLTPWGTGRFVRNWGALLLTRLVIDGFMFAGRVGGRLTDLRPFFLLNLLLAILALFSLSWR